MKVRNIFVTVVTMIALLFSTAAAFATMVEVSTSVSRDFGELDSLDGHIDFSDGFTSGLPVFTGDQTYVGDFTDMALNGDPMSPMTYVNFQFAGISGLSSIETATLYIQMGRADMGTDSSDPRVLINDAAPGSPTVIGTNIGYLEKDGHNAFGVYSIDLMAWLDRLTMETIWFSLQCNYPDNSAQLGGQIAVDWMELVVEGTTWIDDGNDPPPANPVPEPATMLLFGTGLVGLAGYNRRKGKKK